MQVTPIANLESFGSEWILDTSWIAPPATNTLAELIRDLTQQSSRSPETNSPDASFVEPQITLSNLFEEEFENDSAEADSAELIADELSAENTVETDSASDSTPRTFELPEIFDLKPSIPPIQPIEIQQIESEIESEPHSALEFVNPSAPADLTLDNLFEVEFEAEPAVAPENQPVAKLESSPAIEPVPIEPVSIEPLPAESELNTTILDQLDQLLAAPPDVALTTDSQPDSWFLGIDIGTTGISAVLLNQTQCQLYPLYWQIDETIDETNAEGNAGASTATRKFRLSTTVTLAAANPSASALPTIRLEPAPADAVRLRLSDWKPCLKLAVPHYSPQTSQWEPVLQWSDLQSVPLRTLQEALQQLLATLHPDRAAFMPALTCAALGLEANLQAILRNLAGIVVGYPSNWPDTYSLNVREAILQTELVAHPDQIVFVEEPIAALLSALPAADGRSVSLAHAQGKAQPGQTGHLHNADWRGLTLVLTAGASLTELVLVNLPQQLSQLNPTDFYMRSLPYAGQGIDQDVLSQLLLPALLSRDPDAPLADSPLNYDCLIEPFDLNQLGLTDLTLPSAGELDFTKRYRFQQRLFSSHAGQQLLAISRLLKITLQHQPRFTVQFGTQQFTIERQDLTSRVLLPYVQRLNRELNALLAQTNTTAAAVKQVICTGGTASLSAIARWLRQKLPNATIIQDTYPRPDSLEDTTIPSCSRVAYGLATVPLHPQVINASRHQYSDYFLLLELLRTVPPQPVSIETIMQLLEQRGIHTQTCRLRILALLDGHLPLGIIPADTDLALLTLESAINPDYQAIQFAPVFAKQADRTYQPNQPQRNYLQQYLETLLADTEQTLERPLVIKLGIKSGVES